MTENTEKIQQEILADAERKVERTLKRAQREADKLRQAAEKENRELRQRRLAEAQAEAERKARSIIAAIPYEERKIQLLAQEKIFNEVFDAVMQKLSQRDGTFDAKASIEQLLLEALQAMPEVDVTAFVNPQDEKIAVEIIQQNKTKREIKLETNTKVTAGVQLLSADHKLRYDNSVEARLEREKDRLRASLAEVLNATRDANAEK